MVISVHLHTLLQRQTPDGLVRTVELDLPDGSTIEQALQRMQIPYDDEAIILVRNHHIAGAQDTLLHGDRLDIVPAISGG